MYTSKEYENSTVYKIDLMGLELPLRPEAAIPELKEVCFQKT